MMIPEPPLGQFKTMRYFSPKRVFELQPTAVDIVVVPFLNDPAVKELPAYFAQSNVMEE